LKARTIYQSYAPRGCSASPHRFCCGFLGIGQFNALVVEEGQLSASDVEVIARHFCKLSETNASNTPPSEALSWRPKFQSIENSRHRRRSIHRPGKAPVPPGAFSFGANNYP